LVVIAIIGILSSVVLASLTTARTRGTAAAIQNELSNMRAQAELYYSTTGNNSYGNAGAGCTTGLFQTGSNGLGSLASDITSKGATSITCQAGTSTWAATAVYGGNSYCVDYKGVSTSSASAFTVTDGDC
jgi:type II secretory pathway pseudopilin PulG